MINFNNLIESNMFGEYETCKDRRRYINHHYKNDKIKSAIWDYVSGCTSSVNDYLRANYKWDAVTKYLDMAFKSPVYVSKGKIDVYRTVDEDYLNNVYGINKKNIDEHIGDILINNGYMSVASDFVNPWGDTWMDSEIILHIVSQHKVEYLDIDKIFSGKELPSGEQLELLLNRKSHLKIVGSYLKFEDDPEIPKGNRGRFDIDGTLIIECELLDNINESNTDLLFIDDNRVEFNKSNKSLNDYNKIALDRLYGFNNCNVGDEIYYDEMFGINLNQGELIGYCYIPKSYKENERKPIFVYKDCTYDPTWNLHNIYKNPYLSDYGRLLEKANEMSDKYPSLSFFIPSEELFETALDNGFYTMVELDIEYWTSTNYTRNKSKYSVISYCDDYRKINSSWDPKTLVKKKDNGVYYFVPKYYESANAGWLFFTINDRYIMNESWQRNKDAFVPTIKQMKEWFIEFNEKFFNNQLPMIDLLIGDCGNRTWGHFQFSGRRYWKKNRKWADPFNPKNCHIRLSDRFAGTEYNLKNTMVHEMVHYYIYFHYDYEPTRIHGKEFLYEAAKINSKSEWNITPTNDYAENEISDEGIKKAKNRILDEYIIGIFDGLDKWGKFHAFRTSEKYVEQSCKTLKSWNYDTKWYKVKIENPRFGAMSTINRGNSFNYITSGSSIEDVFEKIDEKYKIIDKEEFFPAINNDNSKPLYICILVDDDKCYAAKLENIEVAKKIEAKYKKSYSVDFYKVTGYDETFIMANTTVGSRFRTIMHEFGYIDFMSHLILKYGLIPENIEQININKYDI